MYLKKTELIQKKKFLSLAALCHYLKATTSALSSCGSVLILSKAGHKTGQSTQLRELLKQTTQVSYIMETLLRSSASSRPLFQIPMI